MKLKSSMLLIILLMIGGVMNSQTQAELLKNHVYTLAADSLEGRGLGTEGKLKAVDYIAEQFKQIGLKPIANSYLHQFVFIGRTGKGSGY